MRLLLFCLVAFAALTTKALAQDGRWLRAESPGFVVYSTSSETRVRALTEELEAYDALLRRLTEAPAERSPTRLEIYLFNGPGQYQEAWPGSDSSIRGRYSARPEIIAAYAIYRDTHGLDAQEVLFHEYAHHFMYQHFANIYPAWYVEGFAEFVAATEFEDGRIVLGRSSEARAPWLFSGSWLPMEQLITGMPRDSEEVARFYAQSWLFTHYLFSTQGAMTKFHAYMRELRLGAEPAVAFRSGFGVSPAEMQSTLRTYLRGNPNALALTRPVAVASQGISVTRLPRSADELLPLTTRVRRGWLEDDDAATLLARMRRIAGAPQDPFATLALAEAEVSLGDTAAARALLEPYTAAYPNDVQGHYLMGLSYWQDGEKAEDGSEARLAAYAQARRHFTRAFRIDGNHVRTLYRYVDTYSGVRMDAATSENVLNALLLARQLAPQVNDITFRAADWLLAAGRPAEAIPMLRLIAYNPHGGQAAERAKEMLTQAEAAVAPPPAQ
jgi:tetratricopeptide (TPR) repeat protein